MNRRRFLSMVGLIPAALALPSLPQVEARRTVTFNFEPPRNVDLEFMSLMSESPFVTGGPVPSQSSPQLVMAHGGETILPRQPKTREEETVDAILRFHEAVKELQRVEDRYGFKFFDDLGKAS